MFLDGFIVLFLGLVFFFSVLPQGLCASPAIMPTTACVALASQVKIISTIPSENYEPVAKILAAFTALFSAFPRTKKTSAASLFSTRKIASNSLGLSGSVGIGTTAPDGLLKLYGGTANVGTKIDDRSINFSRSVDGVYNSTIVNDPSGQTLTYNSRNAHIFLSNAVTAGQFSDLTGGTGALSINAAFTYTSGAANLQLNGSAAIGSSYYNNTSVPTNGLIVQGNVGIVFTSPFSAPPIASIADATQAAFANFSWRVKRHQNPAHGMALTAAAHDFDYHSRASPCRKAA